MIFSNEEIEELYLYSDSMRADVSAEKGVEAFPRVLLATTPLVIIIYSIV